MSDLRLGLLTTLETNIGDDFIREGLLRVVRELRAGASLSLEAVNKHDPLTVYPSWHPTRTAGAIIPRLPRGRITAQHWSDRFAALGGSRFDWCDVIMQCGTPILWPRCSLNEWCKPLWHDVLSRLASAGRPVLNVGGGACYPWEHPPATLAGDVDESYAQLMLRIARLTTVRDTLARQLLGSVGPEPEFIPCPAFLAAQVFASPVARPRRRVLVNYMPNGAHFTFGQDIDTQTWENTMHRIVTALASDWELVFLCHDQKEFALAARLWPHHERALPRTVAEYFDTVRGAALGLFNRLHAGVGSAGLGIPSVCIGTDTRLLMVEAIGLPVIYVRNATTEAVLAEFSRLAANREAETQRLLALRETTFLRYRDRLRPWFAP
jgi:hypothetical protein